MFDLLIFKAFLTCVLIMLSVGGLVTLAEPYMDKLYNYLVKKGWIDE